MQNVSILIRESTMKIIIIIFFVIMLNVTTLYAQGNKVTMEKLWTIGNDEKASIEYIFRDPEIAKLDHSGNLYVFDNNANEIMEYSPTGKYIASYGKQGKGPGEFTGITNFCVTNKEELVIFDVPMNRITVFDIKKGKNKIINLNNRIEPAYFEQIGNSLFLVSEKWNILKKNILFNIYNSEYKPNNQEFGDLNSLLDLKDAYQDMFKNSWNICIMEPNIIIATTKWYNSTIYLFRKDNTNWDVTRMSGIKPQMRSYELFTEKDFLKRELKLSVSSYGNKKLFYKVYNTSVGLMTLKNKYILHFSVMSNTDGTYNLGVEVFNTMGKNLGYTRLNTSKDLLMKYTNLLVTDKNGIVYFKEYINKVPVISKYRIMIE